jgi:YfiH family protein
MPMPSLASAAPDSLDASILTAWDEAGLRHGFMSRTGGVSVGPYASFNLTEWVGDDPAAVNENAARWRRAFPRFHLARVAQVHGNVVHAFDGNHDGARPAGDGMVTAARGLALGIFTADCVPILMADEGGGVVAALHSGWRGTHAGIAGEGVNAMTRLGARPSEIRAAMGPAIGLCCFEVEHELAMKFAARIPGAGAYQRAGRPGKAYLDLRGIVRLQLEAAGLDPGRIENVGPCTRCSNDRFFSRRAVRGAVTGLQMSFIGIEA